MEETEIVVSDARSVDFSRRTFLKGATVGAISLTMTGSVLGSLAGCASSAETPLADTAMQLKNVTEPIGGRLEADIISLTEPRQFQVTVPFQGVSTADLQAKIDSGNITWTLAREVGQVDEELFPHQWLGGALEDWRTVETETQPETNIFVDIAVSAKEAEGATVAQLTFSTNTLFGYDGIDFRANKPLVLNSVTDRVGTYTLSCLEDGNVVASMDVDVRPYDYYRTQDEVYADLQKLVDTANENGLYAEIQTIGQSSHGNDINVAFVCKQSSDLDDYQQLVKRMESEPAKVQEELAAGSLKYKTPIMYSNIHSDEIVGADSILEFFSMLASNQPSDYLAIAGLTDEGRAQVKAEMETRGIAWSSLIADKVSGVGYIQGNGVRNPTDPDRDADGIVGKGKDIPNMTVSMDDEEMSRYYDIETRVFDPSAILEEVFFILVPIENADGRIYFTRSNGNGFDLNRDNTYQTQPETQAMTKFIAQWDPISLHEIHGYYCQYQVEPCSPPHDPNNEYDLFIDTAMEQGEAYVAASIVNNETINAAQIPMRDYLLVTEDGSTKWAFPFDDMTSSYTPQYAMLHGTNAFTVELPFGSQDAVDATIYGFVGNAVFIAENKDRMFHNQLERFRRGIENIDEDAIDPFYVTQDDGIGENAPEFRPRYQENGNFFPECYVIPLDPAAQRNRYAAAEMAEYLIRNGVSIGALKGSVSVPSNKFHDAYDLPAGSIVVDMHQAKRNMANAVLYSNLVLDHWTGLYSEPVTNFPDFRGFDIVTVTTPGAIGGDLVEPLESAPAVESVIEGSGEQTIILNSTVQAVLAVNSLLSTGKSVSLVTEGDYKGDYLVDAADADSLVDQFVLDVVKTDEAGAASPIKQGISVYVAGSQGEFMEDHAGRPFGLLHYLDQMNPPYNWDRFAVTEQMGFSMVESADEADVIIGSGPLSEDEANSVMLGKAYVGFGVDALTSVKDAGLDIEFTPEKAGIFDALTTVEFPEQSIITASYASRGDVKMYGYGGAAITKVPDGSTVIVKITHDDFIEGFMDAEAAAAYKGSIQAVDCKADGWNATLFANSLTNKAHQVHEYRYLATAIFEKMLEA